jgi:hypothetical protein
MQLNTSVLLDFSSNVIWDTVTSTDLIKDFSFSLYTEFKSVQPKSGSSPNKVDTSLVKSQLIYIHTKK